MIIAQIISDYSQVITLDDLTRKIKDSPAIGECGAIFTFEGIVRGKDEARTTDELVLTTPDSSKTEKELEEILHQVQEKHGVKDIAVVHYLG